MLLLGEEKVISMLSIQCLKILTSVNITSVGAKTWKVMLIEIMQIGTDTSCE